MSGASAEAEPASGAWRRLATVCLALLALGAAAGVVVPAGSGWDFANFYDAGSRVAAGQTDDLYRAGGSIAGRPAQGAMGFWGTPLSALYYAPLAWLPPRAALVAFKVEVTLALAASLVLVYRHSRRLVEVDEQARFLGLFCLVALLFQPLWTVYRTGGQTTPTVLLLLVAALVWRTAGHPVFAALAYVVAVTIKPALVLGLLFAAVVAGWRFLASAAAGGTVLGALSVGIFGWPLHLEFLARMRAGLALPKGWHYNSALAVPIEQASEIVASRGASDAAAAVRWLVPLTAVAVACTFALVARRARGRGWSDASRVHFAVLLSLPFALLVARTVWEHYLMLLLPLLALLLARAEELPPGGRGLLAAIVVLSLAQNMVVVDLVRGLLPPGVPAIELAASLVKAAPLALTWILVWRGRELLLRIHDRPEAWR